MKHYGDITKLNGWDLPIVDIITGGSPCQDLSIAGKRAGLAGERSGLFMEQIRIIKEMREYDRTANRRTNEHIRPRYMVWENVPGAFSSNKGEDFRAVLEETAKVCDKDATILRPEGGWKPSGCIVGKGWSIAWRVHDAQFWGVPQRRKRIALVADFGGYTAPEILFERKSLFRDIEESGEERKETAEPVREDSEETISFQERAGCSGGVRESLSSTNEQEHCQHSTTNTHCLNSWDVQSKHIQPQEGKAEALYSAECRYGGGESYVMQDKVYGISSYESNAIKSANPNSGIYEADTARTLDNNGGNPACNQGGMIVLEGNGSWDSHRGDGYKESEISYTLNTVEQHAVCVSQDAYDKFSENEKSASLKACGGTYGGGSEALVISNAGHRRIQNWGGGIQSETERLQGCNGFGDTVGALCAGDAKQVGNQMSIKENSLYRVIENHPADSRVKYCEDGVFQTLSARMGTGGVTYQ